MVDPELTLAVSEIPIATTETNLKVSKWDGICTKTVVWIITFNYWPPKKCHSDLSFFSESAQWGQDSCSRSQQDCALPYIIGSIHACRMISNVHEKWSFTTDEINLSSHLSSSFIHFGTNVLLQSHRLSNQLHGKNILAYRDLHTLLSNKPPGVFWSVYT